MFARYECGCIGIPLTNNNAIVVKPCHDSENEFEFFTRPMAGKSFESLTQADNDEVVRQLSILIGAGNDLGKIKAILK